MKISITDLTTERKWRSATGYDQKIFRKLLSIFEETHLKIFGKTVPEREAESPKESVIKTAEDLLLFTLFSLKCGLTYDLLGLVIGMDSSNAKRNQVKGVTVLKSILNDKGYAPVRSFETVEEFEEYFRQYDTLIIDGEEEPIQRPSNKDAQKENYSGQKKTYFGDNGNDGNQGL